MRAGVSIGGLVLTVALWLGRASDNASTIAAAMQATAGLGPPKLLRFAVGFNAAVDLIVNATELFDTLGLEPPTTSQECQSLADTSELLSCFAHSFKHGTAAERWYQDLESFRRIVEAAESLKSAQFHAGGNAALMGEHLVRQKLASDVVLVASVGTKLKNLLSDDMQYASSDSLEKDEVHLILEYGKHQQWGNFKSSRANRFIFSHDITNAELRPLASMEETLKTHQPNVIVVSGVHMLEGGPIEFRRKRVQEVSEFLSKVPESIVIHLELASIGDQGFLAELADSVLHRVDSIGLNEQELSALAVAKQGPHQDHLKQHVTVPDSGLMSDLVLWLLTKYGGESGRLSRVHFHSLTYHIIAGGKASWSNGAAAVAAGTLACSRQACESYSLHDGNVVLQFPEKFKLQLSDKPDPANLVTFDPSQPVTTWSRGDLSFALSPVLVCRAPTKTVGLGDAISATGLAFSVFHHK